MTTAMHPEAKTIPVPPGSELARVLRRAADESALLEANGVRYRVVREDDDPFARYDPARALSAVQRVAGTLAGVHATALVTELLAQRAQDSDGRPA